ANRGCAQVSLENLTDVHARGYAERVQHDVYRVAGFVVGHVFLGHYDGDNTLVTVTTGHLVTRLDATLDGQVDLDDLEYTRCEVVALGDLALLVGEQLVQRHAALGQL